MGYTAGSLSVDILGTATGAINEIKSVISYLDKLQKSLSVFRSINAAKIGQNLAETFKNIGASLKSIADEDIARLGELGNATNRLQKFVKVMTTMDARTVYTHMDSLMRAISSTVGLMSNDNLAKMTQFADALAKFNTYMGRLAKLDFASVNQSLSLLLNSTGQLSQFFQGISTGMAEIDPEKIKAFAEIGKAVGSIANFAKLGSIDFEKIAQGFELMATRIKPFIDEVNKGEKSLTALYGVLQKITKSSGGGGSGKGTGRGGGAFGFLNLAKWTGIFYMGRRIGRVVQGIAQQGADYTETLNLWETAMSGNLGVATEFVNKMNEAYGISEKTLMNAQAIFKNMLGSLGQISEQTAYSLSEGITQMALDYASLYNVTFEKAFEKFQAALAGQVRPIRSVSGYDITENTLYQLYQTLGGEKSVRNLSRTEKQLLSILAIFRQMNASGAVGDLKKTMESYANQSRVLKESWQDVKSYAGLIFVDLLEDYNVLVNINAVMIFIGDTLKAVAESMGAIKSYGGDIFGSTTDSAMEAIEATDELNGKLLDFDKFRALSGSGDEQVGLDEKLLKALSSYDTILSDASMAARNLAEQFKISSGLFDEDGVFQPEKWEELKTNIENVGTALIYAFGATMVPKIVSGITAITTSANGLKSATATINTLLIGGLVYSFKTMIDAFKQGDIATGILAATISTSLVVAFVMLNKESIKSFFALFNVGSAAQKAGQDLAFTTMHAKLLALGLSSLAFGVLAFINYWDNMDSVKRSTTIFLSLAAAISAVAIALAATKGDWLKALSIGATVAGGALTVLTAIPSYEMGASNIDSGTVFRAGEHGKTETVFTAANGKTNVANVQQMRSAFYQALMDYSKSNQGQNQPIKVSIDGREVFEVTTAQANKQGLSWSRV